MDNHPVRSVAGMRSPGGLSVGCKFQISCLYLPLEFVRSDGASINAMVTNIFNMSDSAFANHPVVVTMFESVHHMRREWGECTLTFLIVWD